MSTDRMLRVNELLRREISTALHHALAGTGMDLSAVTVTHVVTHRDLREARVLVSILGHEHEREEMMAVIRHQRADIQQWINRNLSLKYTPRLSFELDLSVERGDRVLKIISDLESDQTGPDADAEPEEGEGDV
jgi:ribosome-binding factor A